MGPKFYILTVLWGAEFRDLFVATSLASLLSPNNIPALKNKDESRFLIVTTDDDWLALQDCPNFLLLKSHIEPIHIRLARPGASDLKMHVMSSGHKAATEQAFQNRAFGVVTCPDVIYSDGTIAALQRHAEQNTADVVLAIGARFEHDAILAELRQTGLLRDGKPLVLAPRYLAKLAINNMHSETKQFEWDTGYYWDTPVVTFWRVPDETTIIAHGFSWTPLLLNYGAIRQHRTEVFDYWTMDAHYIHDNFSDSSRIYVVQDSDELLQVSLTSERSVTYYPLKNNPAKSGWLIGTFVKTTLLRSFVFSHFTDPLRRELFNLPVCIHAGDLSSAVSRTKLRALQIVKNCQRPPTEFAQKFVLTCLLFAIGATKNPMSNLRWWAGHALPTLSPTGYKLFFQINRVRRWMLGLPNLPH